MTEGFNTLKTPVADGLYHKEVYFPFDVDFFADNITVSHHAKGAASDDRYGIMDIPEYVDTREGTVFEVEVKNGWIVKIAYQEIYDNELKRTIVFIPKVRGTVVKTMWFNWHTDTHKTLNRRVYVHG